jgi:hypothetical protein
MKLSRKHPFTGEVNTMDLDVTTESLSRYYSGRGGLIQNVFPHLTADEREFIMTGITPGTFPGDEEADAEMYEHGDPEFQWEERGWPDDEVVPF